MGEGEQLYLVFTSEFEPPGPPEEGFRSLFKAARALISEGVTDEDQIIPTLVFAHEIDRGAAKGAAVDTFQAAPPHMRVWDRVKTVDGLADILKEEPIHADILVRRPPPGAGGEAIPQGVLMQVAYRKDAVEAEHVSRVYRENLAARGMRFGGAPSGSIAYEFVGNRLYLTVESKEEPSADGGVFPSPELVEALYSGLLKDLGKRLTTRGKHFEVNRKLGISNLIPASVAFLLRASGGIRSRREIHRLLNDQVFRKRVLVEDGYAASETVQLWRDVPKAGTRIARALPLFWGRPFPEHFIDY